MSEMLQAARIKRKKRDYVFLFLLLLIFLLLICSFLPGWISVNTATSELPFSLHSVKEADYTIDHNMAIIPEIGLDIIEDIMRDNNVSEAEIAIRVGTLSSSLLTPVPRSTGILSVPNTPVPATPVNVPTYSGTNAPVKTAVVPTSNLPTSSVPTSNVPTTVKTSPPHSPDDPTTATAIPTATPTLYVYIPPAPTEVEDDDPVPALDMDIGVSGYMDNDSSGTVTLNDGLQYQFTVSNIGNNNILSNINIIDHSFGLSVTCPMTSLADGQSMLCIADSLHTITLVEANAGAVSMNATVLGVHGGNNYTKSDSLTIGISQNPSIDLQKSLLTYDDNDLTNSITNGDDLWYQFSVSNTGNVSVNSIAVVDDTFSLPVNCPTGTLDPGNSVICSATSAHRVTSDEASAGKVANSATASAQFAGTLYTASDSLVTIANPAPPNPSISLAKALASYNDNDNSSGISLGDGLVYKFTVSNTGNTNLSAVQVTDLSFAIPVTCPETSLAPAGSMLCSADSSYIITIPDAIAGQVSNTASVSGEYLSTPYTTSDSLTTTIDQQSTGLVSGYVYDDLDGDGDFNDPDSGIAGVTIQLTEKNVISNLYATTTTNANGFFSFSNLPPADYSVYETNPPGYTSTADSYGPNNDRANFTLADGEHTTDIVFLDHNPSAGCSNPDPANGFVASTNPANGAVNVPMSTTTITIVYNQAMMASGGQSVDRADKYAFNNQTSNKKVDISGITYDSVTYTAVLTIDTTDPDWQAGSLYELTIKTVQNACGTSQTSITRTFTTQ